MVSAGASVAGVHACSATSPLNRVTVNFGDVRLGLVGAVGVA